MVSEQTLVSCFSNLGCNLTNKDIISKCLEICRAHELNEDAFVEQWVAYTVPNSLDIEPTVDLLNKFEEDELNKESKNPFDAGVEAIAHINFAALPQKEKADNVLDIYNTEKPSFATTIKRPRSPSAETENESKIRAVELTFTPTYYGLQPNDVPNRAPSTTVRGKVLQTFGPNVTWKNQDDYQISIVKADIPHIPKDAKYMFTLLCHQMKAIVARSFSLGERLCYDWNDSGPANSKVRYVTNVASISQTPFRTWGRIVIVLDKRTNSKIILMQGCKRPKACYSPPIVRLDLSGIKHYSIFPGQVVAIEGTSVNGEVLVVKQFFAKPPPLFAVPSLSKNVRVYVAVGPFTAPDNLFYQPLWDLMERVAEDQPEVLILVGPFLEYTHPEIKKCKIKDSYSSLFDKVLARILQFLQGKFTRVVLVSSNRDAHHEPVYPTPEVAINTNKFGSNASKLYSMPDPCIINIEDLHIGVTSVDIIRHLGQQEISNTSGMDRMGRLANHVLSQATFYPLYPPLRGLNFDTEFWKKYACFENQPHVLILPSDLRYFCKPLGECLVINPERLQKYTYAKLCIKPVYGGKWDPNKVSCEIAKV